MNLIFAFFILSLSTTWGFSVDDLVNSKALKPFGSASKTSFTYSVAQAFDSRLSAIHCKSMAANFENEEPFSFVYKKGTEDFFAVTNKDNDPRVIAELKQPFLNSEMKLDTYIEKQIRFQPQLVGPYKSFEAAAQMSCDSFYKSKLKLINKFKVKNTTKKFFPHPVRLNVGIQPEFLERTYNQVVDCDFFKIDSAFYQLTPDYGKADIFSFSGQHYAYSPMKSLGLNSLKGSYSLFFSGPFKTEQLAAKRACQLQQEQASAIIAEFEKKSEVFKLHEICEGVKQRDYTVRLGQIFQLEPVVVLEADLSNPGTLIAKHPFLNQTFAKELEKIRLKFESNHHKNKKFDPIFLQAKRSIWMVQSVDPNTAFEKFFYGEINTSNFFVQEADFSGNPKGFTKQQMKQKICDTASKFLRI